MKDGTVIEIIEDIYYVKDSNYVGGIVKESNKDEVIILYLSAGEQLVYDEDSNEFNNNNVSTSLDADMYTVLKVGS